MVTPLSLWLSSRWPQKGELRLLRSRPFDQGSDQGGAAGQFRYQDVLVVGVGAIAYAAEAVEGRDAQSGGEVAVGAAAHSGFA